MISAAWIHGVELLDYPESDRHRRNSEMVM